MYKGLLMRRITIISLFVILSCLTVSAQKAFTPISKSQYEIWGHFLDDNYLKSADVQFLVDPSLIRPVPLVSLSLSNGVIRACSSEKEYSMKCSSGLYTSLKLLAKHAVKTANFASRYQGLDGTTYFLFTGSDGVTCWSPYGMCAKTIDLFKQVADAVKAGDRELLEKQISVSDSLYHVYKTYYPRDFVVIGKSVSIPSAPETGHKLSLFADTGFDWSIGGFSVDFSFPGDTFRDEYRNLYYEKYENVLQEVAYWIFAHSDFADKSNNATFIVDESISEPQANYSETDGYVIKLKESDLTADKMLSLLQQLYK